MQYEVLNGGYRHESVRHWTIDAAATAAELRLWVRAGGAVLVHGNLWHRALPTVSAK